MIRPSARASGTVGSALARTKRRVAVMLTASWSKFALALTIAQTVNLNATSLQDHLILVITGSDREGRAKNLHLTIMTADVNGCAGS